ncbi:MAG: ABC transporter ATP-binding protein [Acidobacteria bacterium]|nr:MAG: ABC transporter ATP-binding protein [Acidobacteriota bacterium]
MSDFRKLLPYIRSYLHLLAMSMVLLVISGALEAGIVLMLEPIFNQWSSSGASAQSTQLVRHVLQPLRRLGLNDQSIPQIALLLVLFSFFKGVCLYFAEYAMSYSGLQVVASLRKDLYSHLLNQSLAFYSRNSTGKLMARVITDTERIQETVSKTLADYARQSILLVAFLVIIFLLDWKLALLSLLIAPFVLVITLRLGRRVRKASTHSQENLSEISNNLQETIAGQRIVKAFSMEPYERSKFDKAVDLLVGASLRVVRTSALNSPVVEFVGYFAFVPFLFYAHYQISRDALTLGAFATFVVSIFRLWEPMRKISRMHLHIQQAFASSTRVFELLETRLEIVDAPDARPLPAFQSDICFESVSFGYKTHSRSPVLHHIDLKIRAGEVVALVGPSGAGKTTLAGLIPRFYDPTEGRVTIDGIDIRGVSQKSLRRQIAVVTQDTFLFNDTVRNNISYGREDCTLDEIVEAAKAALIHEFVVSLPQAYETVIGERGQLVSGGQRQRLAIARAILKNAPILILDEATSSLDSESERLVQEAIYNLMQRRTTLVIAHRLSTVRIADRIVVMQGGRIVEVGDHESLMSGSGVYRRLHDLQFSQEGTLSHG